MDALSPPMRGRRSAAHADFTVEAAGSEGFADHRPCSCKGTAVDLTPRYTLGAIARGSRDMPYPRITADPERMGGIPCIRDTRIPVATILGMVADSMGEAEILDGYPDLTAEDVREALRFAAEAVREREIPLSGKP